MEISHNENNDIVAVFETSSITATGATGEEATSTTPASMENEGAGPNPIYGRPVNEDHGIAGGRRSLNLRKEMRLATWNVRTLYQSGKLANVLHEMNRCNIDVFGLAETRWDGQGCFKTSTDETFVYSGGSEHQRGVGIILSKKAKACMLSY